MNELSRIFLNISDGETVVLEKDKVYDVCREDSFYKVGYYCSNTAKKHENPDGSRYAAIFLKDKKNIVIEGNGATILVHGKMTPLLFDKCENVTLRNLKIDYACPTMSEFTVISNNGESVVIRINSECLFYVENNELIWHGEKGSDGECYWTDSAHGDRRHVKLYDPETRQTKDFPRDDMNFDAIEIIDENTLRVYPKNKNADFRDGCIYQTRNIVRDQTGSLFQRCSDLLFENVRIMFMHGLGIVSQFCENVTFRNCDLTPKEGRTIASTADFFQFSGCKGQLTVENCKAFGAHDDYINAHGTHLRVVDKNDEEKSLTVRFMHPETWGLQAFEKGDRLEFIRWDTLIPYGECIVEKYERLDDTDIKLFVSDIPNSITVGKDVVENATWTPDLLVSGCDFGPTSGRGILCTTRGKVIIENNRFTNLCGPALLLEDDCNFWFESGYTKEVVFRNNVVSGCDFGKTWETSPVIRYTPKIMKEDSVQYVHGRLILDGNVFEKSSNVTHSIWLEYLAEAVIKNNRFDAPYIINKKVVGFVDDSKNTVSDERGSE
ncbi:MAG: right-handed parallel beta-helix repeat-containing protein [Clostridia bacterium]|nr:right-handed parallel beta-helix repeat-containing protein [Clostridia bacterium]